ncbi:MAG: hypothetical protein NT025_00645 [bacterium]|nr:hypothetical protein [bacterium]
MNKDNIIFGLFTAVFLVLYAASAFSLLSDTTGSRLFYMLTTGVPPMVALLLFPRAGLVVVLLLVCSVRWMYDWFELLPREATWLSDILIMMLVLRTVLFMVARRVTLIKIERLIVVLLAYAVFTSVLNGVDKNSLAAGSRFAFRYIMLFLAAYHLNLTPRFLKGYIFLIFGIALFQLPVVLAQFQKVHWSDPDAVYGTLGRGGTTGMGLFLIVLVAYLVSRMLEESRVRISYLALIVLMSIPPILGGIKFFFMFIPLLLAVMVRKTLFRKPVLVAGLFIGVVCLALGLNYFAFATSRAKVSRQPLMILFDLPRYFRHDIQVAEYGQFDRGFHYSQAIRLGLADPVSGLFGHGMGSNTASAVFNTSSSTLSMFAQWNMTSLGTMGVIWLYTEYGLCGVILFFYLLWLMFRRAKILLASENREERIYGRTLEAIVVIYAVWNFYGPAWQLDSINIGFWPLAALLVRLSYSKEPKREPSPAASEAVPGELHPHAALTAAAR